MNVNDFIKLREKDWQTLQTLINQHQGREALTASEVRELGRLYRAATSDLALARRDYPDQRVTVFLNQLLTRAHSYIYQQDVTDFKRIITFFTRTFPQTFRQTWLFTLVAFLLLFVPVAIGFHLGYTHPEVAEPLGLVPQREMLSDHELWTDISVRERPYASAFIMSNNIRVAILAFGGGVLFGLVSVYVLVMNGLHLGAVMGLAFHYGMGESLFGFVVGHGVIELSVIFISGSAGLQLGWALLNPGPYTRRDALSLAARRSVTLLLATVPLLVIAGLIEGFLSPSNAPLAARLLVAVLSGLALYGYVGLVGRAKSAKEVSEAAIPLPMLRKFHEN
jgi:uncharacterized membrane protein SpoIIM required for sporulation